MSVSAVSAPCMIHEGPHRVATDGRFAYLHRHLSLRADHKASFSAHFFYTNDCSGVAVVELKVLLQMQTSMLGLCALRR